MAAFIQYLWCNVVRCAAQCLLAFAFVLDPCGQAEVADFQIQLIVQKYIAQLEIPMNDTILMQIFDTLEQLMNVEAALVVGDIRSTFVQFHH